MSDDIRIPYVTLESKADLLPFLAGKRFYAGKTEPWSITRAEQHTKFELYERGARVRVETSAGAAGGSPPPGSPRAFIFDKPFFVFLWRDLAEWPYFGAWIGDESALKAFSKAP